MLDILMSVKRTLRHDFTKNIWQTKTCDIFK